jgi:signal transduction histidine kinase
MSEHLSNATVLLTAVERGDPIVLQIADNGRGFATVRHQAVGHGYGLTTMRERAHRLGGRIEINSAPGTGTEVIVTVPYLCHSNERE